MKNIKAVIFDLGGVLINWDPVSLYIKLFKGNAKKAKWFISNVCNQDWNIRQDAGRSFQEAVILKTEEFPEYKEFIEAYYTHWEDMLIGEIPGTVEILKRLKKIPDLKMLALSNWSAETFPIAKKQFDFLQLFEDIAVSGELKMIKPNKDIFEHVISKHVLIPEQTIFIDDNIENVEAAANLNLNAILFKDVQQLKKGLNKFDLSV